MTAGATGYSAIELLFAVGIVLTLSAAAVPQTLTTVDRYRMHGAVRYVSSHLQDARLEAILRSANVGVQFVAIDGAYTMAAYLDGNGNGVRKADIQNGTDPPIGWLERIPDRFQGVDFGLGPALPPIDPSGTAPAGDPIKLGSSDILTFTPFGSSSSGSLYLRGSGDTQAVVRVYGVTGKVRALEFVRATISWKPL